MRYFLKRLFVVGFIFVVLMSVIGLSWPLMIAGESKLVVQVKHHGNAEPLLCDGHHLRLLSANLAHGRSDGAHQMRQNDEQITENLRILASVLKREQAHLVALQEADAPSWWSGDFNHLSFLAEEAGYAQSVHGPHVTGLGLSYGTGFLSNVKINAAWSHTFEPTPPTMSKGFTLIKIPIMHPHYSHIYAASLHTDFASASARSQQLDYLAEVLLSLDAPYVVLGDFNCQYMSKGSPLPLFLEKVNLKTYKPYESNHSFDTFPALNVRIDWICIPRHWMFQRFNVLKDVVSDHSLVVADIKVVSPSP